RSHTAIPTDYKITGRWRRPPCCAGLLSKLRITRLAEPAAAAHRNQSMGVSAATRHDHRTTVTVDRDGIVRQWGDAVTEIVGHSADDTVGRDLNVLIPPALRALHWWGFDRAM